MKYKKTMIFVERANFGRSIDIHMAIDHQDGFISFFEPPILQKIPQEDSFQVETRPFLSLGMEAGQKLIDELWNAGLRPTQSGQSHGQAEATGRHLNDMRAMVAKLAKVELPK